MNNATLNVPQRYFGVWSRTLLQTPDKRDTSTFVRWMQLGQWHVDVRIPESGTDPQQGFSGITVVTQREGGEVCTWQRQVDYSPPRATVDEGFMVFETSERVIETGIHGVYHEVWERLSGSTGQRIALAEPGRDYASGGTRIFVAGTFLMRVQPCAPIGPAFEISFGRWDGAVWTVEQSTIAALVGQALPLVLTQTSDALASVQGSGAAAVWDILEWAQA